MTPAPPRGAIPAHGSSLYVDASGVRLHLLEYGRGAPSDVVIVPGITSPAITWEFVAEELARDWHVVTLDLRGRGLSDRARDGYTLADYAADLAATIHALELRRPAVLGHSLGARIAAAFGAQHPQLRGPLVIADPPLSGPGRDPYPTSLESFLDSIRAAKSGAGAEGMRPFFPTWTDEQLRLRAEWLPTCDEDAVAQTWRHFHDEDFFDFWPHLEPPVLFLYGAQSPVVTQRGAREAADANPRAEMVEVHGAGHMIPWDNPAIFLTALRHFLRSVGF